MEDMVTTFEYEGIEYLRCPSCDSPIRASRIAQAVGNERQAVLDGLREAERVGIVSEDEKLRILSLIYRYATGADAKEGL